MNNAGITTCLAWVGDIETLTVDNENFRTVIHTGAHTQLTLMSIPAGGEIGWEKHDNLDQFLRLEQALHGWTWGRQRTKSTRATRYSMTGR